MIRLLRHLGVFIAFSAQAQNPAGDSQVPPATPKPRTAAELAAQTVVVFNENDRDSLALAGLYMEKRKIPPGNLVALRCPNSEEISRADYDKTIAEPLRKTFTDRGWWKLLKDPKDVGRVEETSIHFVVLIRGIPLRIQATSGYEGDVTDGRPAEIFGRNEAAVDSELAGLGLWSRRISGILLNPYHRSTDNISETDLHSQLLVCRLDGPTPAVVHRMIEDTVTTEATGLRGFAYVDARGMTDGPLLEGDRWLHEAALDARQHGLPVILDNGPALFPTPYPMRRAALYLGWYSEEAFGPFTRDDFRFTPGAVAVHLHSFSAVTLRDPRRYWCAPLLQAGAAATLGNVAEPYLNMTSNLNVFAQRLREGFTFGEACYMSVPYLSWMNTFVGDPLYRPFVNLKPEPKNEWDAYRAGVKMWLEKDRAAGEAALNDSAKQMRSGIVSEGLGLLELAGRDHAKALAAFQRARANYSTVDDRVRVAIHEAGALAATKGDGEAARFLRSQAAAYAGTSGGDLLDALAATYGPASQPPKAKPVTPKKTR